MGDGLIFQIATGVFLGQIGVVSVLWGFSKLIGRHTAGFVELTAFSLPLLIVGASVYLG